MTGLPCRCCGGRERVVPMAFGGRRMILMTWLFIMLMMGSGEHSGAEDHCLVAAAAWFFDGIAVALCGGFVCGWEREGNSRGLNTNVNDPLRYCLNVVG
eukprot:scaffold655_cov126-Skeletonema_dohrnii-CCMP3373.AAC.6